MNKQLKKWYGVVGWHVKDKYRIIRRCSSNFSDPKHLATLLFGFTLSDSNVRFPSPFLPFLFTFNFFLSSFHVFLCLCKCDSNLTFQFHLSFFYYIISRISYDSYISSLSYNNISENILWILLFLYRRWLNDLLLDVISRSIFFILSIYDQIKSNQMCFRIFCCCWPKCVLESEIP